jgi:hypothetical protein
MTTQPKLCECGCGTPAAIARKTQRTKGYVLGEPTRFAMGHRNKHPRPPATCHPDRILYERATGRCKECYRKQWLRDNREHVNKMVRESQPKVVYGLSKEAYDNLLRKQDGKCAICKNPFMSHSHYRGTRIDHIHGTKVVRGLLCHGCNLFVGYLEKRKQLLPVAMAYIWSGERGSNADPHAG